MDAWVVRLKNACEAGYYRTEAAEGRQEAFPWQNRTCKDCPFWSSSICHVRAEYRGPLADTCPYFDGCNHTAAEEIIQERQMQGFRRWWEWFNERGAAR